MQPNKPKPGSLLGTYVGFIIVGIILFVAMHVPGLLSWFYWSFFALGLLFVILGVLGTSLTLGKLMIGD